MLRSVSETIAFDGELQSRWRSLWVASLTSMVGCFCIQPNYLACMWERQGAKDRLNQRGLFDIFDIGVVCYVMTRDIIA